MKFLYKFYIVFQIVFLGAFLTLIPIPVSADIYPYGTKAFNYYCSSSESVCNETLPAGGVFLIDLYVTAVGPYAGNAIICNDGATMVMFTSSSDSFTFFPVWDYCTNFDVENGGNQDLHIIGHYLDYDPNSIASSAYSVTSSDSGNLIFGIALILFFVSLWFWAYIYNSIFKRAK